MPTSLLYRIASALLVLFALGHTLAFRSTKDMEGADSVVSLMKSVRFTVMGSQRVYYDFFVGFGLIMTVFLLFAAVLTWHLGGEPREVLKQMPLVTWGLALTFVGVTVLNQMYFFPVPLIFSALISLCLLAAAWISR